MSSFFGTLTAIYISVIVLGYQMHDINPDNEVSIIMFEISARAMAMGIVTTGALLIVCTVIFMVWGAMIVFRRSYKYMRG